MRRPLRNRMTAYFLACAHQDSRIASAKSLSSRPFSGFWSIIIGAVDKNPLAWKSQAALFRITRRVAVYRNHVRVNIGHELRDRRALPSFDRHELRAVAVSENDQEMADMPFGSVAAELDSSRSLRRSATQEPGAAKRQEH